MAEDHLRATLMLSEVPAALTLLSVTKVRLCVRSVSEVLAVPTLLSVHKVRLCAQ